MKKINNPVEHVKPTIEAYRALYGADVISITLYGSAAGEDFNPSTSDINLLIVLSAMDAELIAQSAALQKKHMRQRINRPLFIDKNYIATSIDSYPIEFFDMKRCYKVLHGEDVLSGITPDKNDLRLQVERELKGKWLHLLQEYPALRDQKKRLSDLMAISLKTFLPVFRALLMLKNVPVPKERSGIFSSIETTFSLDAMALQNVFKTKNASLVHDAHAVYLSYIKAVKKIIDTIENQ